MPMVVFVPVVAVWPAATSRLRMTLLAHPFPATTLASQMAAVAVAVTLTGGGGALGESICRFDLAGSARESVFAPPFSRWGLATRESTLTVISSDLALSASPDAATWPRPAAATSASEPRRRRHFL